MATCAGVVLAGGRSSRMGTSKAALEWHGSTLLERICGLVRRGVDGPVVVVRAPGQPLPALPAGVGVVDDPVEGRGPLQGIAAGLAAVAAAAGAAYVSSTDVPLLHPAFVRRVAAALDEGSDVVLPLALGHRQPLSAVYRTGLVALIEDLLAADLRRPGFLFERCRVRMLDEAALLADPALAAADPGLASLRNLNDAADYAAARAEAPPLVRVERPGGGPALEVAAADVRAAARAAGIALDGLVATVAGEPEPAAGRFPLAAGDRVRFRAPG